MASEVGVLDVAPENVKHKGRLQPGRMFLVDFEQGRLIPDEELKRDVSTRRPYQEWLKNQRITLDELPEQEVAARFDDQSLLEQMQAFGYSTETLQFMLIPLIKAKKDPINSMGEDAALACMSDKPRMLYDYFQATLRSGDESGDRFHSRRDCDVARVLHRPRRQHPRLD